MNANGTDTENKPSCSICLEEGPDEEGQELMSGCCSCRGTSGGVHFSCLKKWAQSETKKMVEKGYIDTRSFDSYWLTCFTCEQSWTGVMAASIGKECAEFVNEEFPEFEELQIVALGTKMDALSTSDAPSKELVQACDEVLSAVAEYESTGVQAVPLLILNQKYRALMGKGDAFLEQNDPTRAIEHFEEGKEIILQMGMDSYTTDRLTANMNFRIARAKTKLPGVDKESAFETVLQHQMHIFELSKDAYGERDCRTLNRGLRLADTLVDLERFDEATPLLESLYHTSQQLHGRDHLLTKKIDRMLQIVLRN